MKIYEKTYTSELARFFTDKETFKKNWITHMLTKTRVDDTNYENLGVIFEKAYKQTTIEYKNSVQGKTRLVGALDFIHETYKDEKILVENGVIFRNSREVFAPTVESEIYLFKRRKTVKKLGNYWLTEGNDPIVGAIYDNLQKNIKILMNTYYGVLTNPYSRFYNRDLGDSITTRGRSSISVSALSIEGAFGKRIPQKTEALLTYFENAAKSEVDEDILLDMNEVYNTHMYGKSETLGILDEFHLMNHYDKPLLEAILKKYTTHERCKIFFKNNFKRVAELKIFKENIVKFMKDSISKSIPFLDPNEVPFEEANSYINNLRRISDQVLTAMYVYSSDYIAEREVIATNSQEVIQSIDRQMIPVIDTDSNFLSYENEYFMLYDILKDSIKDIPPADDDNTFYTISNMCAIIMTQVIDTALARYKRHVNILPEKNNCLKLKNEFLYLKLLITSRKKNYIGLISLKEGKPYPKPKLDVKGLVFKKSSVNSNIGDNVEGIVSKVLKSDKLDIGDIIADTRKITHNILDAHKDNRLLDYCVALKLKTKLPETDISDYRYKAVTLWNALATEEKDIIETPASFYAIPISITDKFKEKHPEVYQKIVSWLNEKNTLMIKRHLVEILDNPKSKKYEFISFVQQNFDLTNIHSADDWKDIRTKALKLKKERKLKISAEDIPYWTESDISKIAYPITSEVVPEFILDLVNTDNSLVLINSLLAPVIQELHIVCPRNTDGKRLVTNIIDA